MLFGLALLVIIYLLYVLLVKGALWKIIVGFFGWIGMYLALGVYFPGTKQLCFTLSNYNFTWSQVIPTIIIMLAMMYTRE